MPTRNEPWPPGTPCWVDVQVDDTTAARTFYSSLFGWQIEDSPEEFGGYLMAMKDGAPAAGIGPKPDGMPMPSVWTTYLASTDADATAADVTAAGGQVMMPPFDVGDVGRMTVALDPTGAAFGIWQAGSHAGAGIYNENGAYVWNECHTRDFAAAKAFYAQVFGYTYTGMGDATADDGYATFTVPGGADVAGGICDDTAMPGAPEVPAHWLTWFAVDDVDATTERATGLGASTLMGPDDSPVGRMVVLAGQQGEVFGLIQLGAAPATQ